MAWGRVPIVGNVRLIILSERIVRKPTPTTTTSSNTTSPNSTGGNCPERLIVRWKTCGKTTPTTTTTTKGKKGQVDKIGEWLGRDFSRNNNNDDGDEEFCGLFIFEFDGEGRILEHTIEHVVEGGDWEKERGGMSKVVSVTEWLLGKVGGGRGKVGELEPGLAFSGLEGEEERRLIRRG